MHSKIKLYFRGRGRRKILPVTGADGENNISIIAHRDGYRRNTQTFSADGITEALDTGQGGGRGHHVAIPVLTPDRAEKHQNGRRFKDNGEPMFTLTSQDKHGVGIEVLGGVYTNPSPDYNRGILDGASRTLKADSHPAGVALKIREATKKGYSEAYAGDSINFSVPNSKTRTGRVGRGVAQTLDTSCNQGIFVQVSEELTVYAIWYEKYQCYIAIRKLTPKECFRLQGWTDDYFEKASFVNSDSQLYKQAGNGVTVDVVYAIGKKIAEYENKSLEEFSRYMNKPEKEAEQTKGERRWRD